VLGELAAMRVPDLELLDGESVAPTFREAVERGLGSRIDVAENTKGNFRSAVAVIVPLVGGLRVDSIEAADVAELVAALCETRKRETVRKMLLVLGMVFDHAGVAPNPARDKTVVKLPFERQTGIVPPTAKRVRAVHDLLPTRYRLPLVVLDATGMRLGEVEGLTWGDVDESRGRWRVSQAVSKTGRARWVNVALIVFDAVTALVPRDDRTPDRPVFQGFGGDRFRTAVTRACTAAGVPAFSPHDLRHRRISLLHLGGVPWARIGEHVGQRNLAVTANTYSHVLADEAELDYAELLA
jgi:integrase